MSLPFLHRRALAGTLALGLAACGADSEAPTFAPEAPSASAARAAGAEGYATTPDGVRLHYRVLGNGADTVLVLNGGPGGLSMSYLAGDLAPLATRRTVIFYDQRSTGWSDLRADPAELAPAIAVADLEALRLHFGLEKLTLVGHSWGAMLAGFYAEQHPDRVERLLLVAPGPVAVEHNAAFFAARDARLTPQDFAALGAALQALGEPGDPRPACNAFFDVLFSAYMHRPEAVDHGKGPWCDGPDATVRAGIGLLMASMEQLVEAGWDLRPALATVSAPALVVHGAADAIPLASSQQWAASLPRGELVVMEDAGHFPWLEQRGAFLHLADRFLAGEMEGEGPPPAR